MSMYDFTSSDPTSYYLFLCSKGLQSGGMPQGKSPEAGCITMVTRVRLRDLCTRCKNQVNLFLVRQRLGRSEISES